MPVFRLTDALEFPHPSLAEDDGLLAVGGDLSVKRLLLAYSNGIFPWYSEGRPILWWCPDPRCVLYPDELRVNRSLRRAMAREPYRITLDQAFHRVIVGCAQTPRTGEAGTWITREMQLAYEELHELGFAHSVEAWDGDELVGGLYGVSLGSVFFGESMFAVQPDASKIAFVQLVEQLRSWAFTMIDCQVVTEHLLRFGARTIVLDAFLGELEAGLARPTRRGRWSFDL